MRAAVIVNSKSGRSANRMDSLPELLSARGIKIDTFAAVDNERELRKAVKRARTSGIGHIIVGGGDGSMATAVDVLAHHDAVLGVLPLGTGNSFARSLGLDDSLDRAIEALEERRVERVDLGIVNGTYFANFATIGLSAEIAAAAPRALKRAIGAASYVASAIVPFANQKPFRAKLRWNDDGKKRETLDTVQIVVASGRFFGHRPIAPDATIVDHRLAVFTTTGVTHVEVARMYVAMGLGIQNELPDAVAFSTRKIEIRTKPDQPISIDGNAFGRTPATFRVSPGALRVIVGPDFDEANR